MIAFEEEILNSRRQFEELVALVQGQAQAEAGRSDNINSMETALWAGLMGVGLALLRAYVVRHGDGDVGETVETPDGRTLRRSSELHDRRYVSVFGSLPIERYVYSERESQVLELVPLDAALALPDSEFSLLLQRWAQGFSAKMSFAEATESLRSILGFGITVRTQERLNRQMAGDVEEFRETLPIPTPDSEGDVLVVAVDCKGVPMVRNSGDAPGKKGKRRRKGEKKNKKKMAAVAAVYSIERHPRTPEDILDETLRKESDSRRPKPQNKRLRAEMTRLDEADHGKINGKDHVLAWAGEEVESRTPESGKPLVCILDGERALWRRVLSVFPLAIFILDIWHVLEYLYKAAHALYGEGTAEAEETVENHLRMLLEGKVGFVIGALKQMRTKHQLRGSRKKAIEKAIGYLENNREYMKYDEYLAAGYPIGSGVAEGACRHLVKDRMEGTGMHWTVAGAQAMLNVRSTYLNGDWQALADFRAQKVESNYEPQIAMLREIESRRLDAAS